MYFIHIYNIELKKEKENRWKEKSTCFNTLKVKMTMEPQDGGHSNHIILNTASVVGNIN